MTLVTHQFADTTQETNAGFTTPLWIVGDNPFQEMQREDEGYVVHLAQPWFIARWSVGDEPSTDHQDLAEGLALLPTVSSFAKSFGTTSPFRPARG